MTSVAAAMPAATSTSDAVRFRRAHLVDRGVEVCRGGLALPRARDQHAGPESLGQDEPIARSGAALAQQPVGMGGADDRQPVLGLGVADRVAAGERAAGLADLGRGAAEDLGEDVARQVLGERRDRQREQDPAAHREDVGQGVGRRDLAERPRVVDERREEVERADDREVVADAVGGGVVGRVQPGDQGGIGVRRGLGAKAAQRVGEQVGPELRRTAAAVGQLGQAEDSGDGVERRSCADDRRGARYHRDGSGRVPVGPLVFKTSGAALGAARWVRLPRVPATEARCRPSRSRDRDRRASSACSPSAATARGRP